ncbi:hypothetical protein C6P41_003284, partial [Kluyveromyces marxianus]
NARGNRALNANANAIANPPMANAIAFCTRRISSAGSECKITGQLTKVSNIVCLESVKSLRKSDARLQ